MNEHKQAGGPMSGFPTNPNEMLKMMTDLYQKAMDAFTKGDLAKGLPMDPSVFLKQFEELIKRMNEGLSANGQMPMDPTAMMKYLQDTMQSMSGGNNPMGMMDPNRFRETFEKMFGGSPFGQMGEGNMNMAEMMNPAWWMKMGEKAMREGAGMMSGAAAPKSNSGEHNAG